MRLQYQFLRQGIYKETEEDPKYNNLSWAYKLDWKETTIAAAADGYVMNCVINPLVPCASSDKAIQFEESVGDATAGGIIAEALTSFPKVQYPVVVETSYTSLRKVGADGLLRGFFLLKEGVAYVVAVQDSQFGARKTQLIEVGSYTPKKKTDGTIYERQRWSFDISKLKQCIPPKHSDVVEIYLPERNEAAKPMLIKSDSGMFQSYLMGLNIGSSSKRMNNEMEAAFELLSHFV